jgi:hypothetical protein
MVQVREVESFLPAMTVWVNPRRHSYRSSHPFPSAVVRSSPRLTHSFGRGIAGEYVGVLFSGHSRLPWRIGKNVTILTKMQHVRLFTANGAQRFPLALIAALRDYKPHRAATLRCAFGSASPENCATRGNACDPSNGARLVPKSGCSLPVSRKPAVDVDRRVNRRNRHKQVLRNRRKGIG